MQTEAEEEDEEEENNNFLTLPPGCVAPKDWSICSMVGRTCGVLKATPQYFNLTLLILFTSMICTQNKIYFLNRSKIHIVLISEIDEEDDEEEDGEGEDTQTH
jgi:hypothetical protein